MFGSCVFTNILLSVSLLTLLSGSCSFRASLTPKRSNRLEISSTQKYTIMKTSEKGHIALATKDILPGELILCEAEPILYLSEDLLSTYDTQYELTRDVWKLFNTVVSPDKKKTYLALFGPTTGVSADQFRSCAWQMRARRASGESSDEEVDTFVKVMQVIKFNAFTLKDRSRAVYTELTRFSHSCAPNCNYSFRGNAVYCYAKKYIKEGEELTISYIATSDVDPTHERRYQCLETKEFTCHCPRCDALGDDTRQFECFDPDCKGVMMVCQPINQKKTTDPALTYTGVEYVEPHLLPCTVCHRAAPADYQTKMFATEDSMLRLGPALKQGIESVLSRRNAAEQKTLLTQLQDFPIHRRHAAALPILQAMMMLKTTLNNERMCSVYEVQRTVADYVATLEYLIPFPCDYLCNELCVVAMLVCKYCISSVFSPAEKKDICTKALRMYLLLHGRDRRDDLLDAVMLTCHEKLPSARSTEVCAFCEESSQRAALTLSRCGQCRQVCYCSAGCQKAHWKLHKKECKAPEGK